MKRRSAHLYQLGKDEQGVTVIEFALISPVFLFMLMGTFDIGYAIYMRSTLNGAVQLAARDSSLQTAADATARAAIDTKVRNVIQSINRDATVTVERKNYASYDDVERMEDYTDGNTNGTCDNGEPFDDANSSGDWDNVGQDGVGGARDSVLYSITVSYDTLFPFSGYDRSATGRKITGYETRSRNKYVTTPGGTRTYQLPIYETTKAARSGNNTGEISVPVFKNEPAGTRTVKVPIYETTKVARSGKNLGEVKVPVFKNEITGTRTVKMPQYVNEVVPLPRNPSPTIEVPVYRLVQTGEKTHKVPITELVEIPRTGNPNGEVKMPIYEFVVATRKTGKTVVDYEEVSVPVYVNIISQTDRGPRLRRVFVRNETIRRPKLDTKRTVSTGETQYIQRKLVGYQTVSKPTVVLSRKITGYKDIIIPLYKREQVGTETVKRPTETIKRRFVGYKTKVIQKAERVFVGYETIKRPTETLQRRLVGYETKTIQKTKKVIVGYKTVKRPTEAVQRKLVGYKTVVKQLPPTKVLAGTETYKVPTYQDSDASFNIAGISNSRTMTAQTILKNQPYGDQTVRTTTPGNCT
jgi:Flp pilus assembly protein TadG